MSTVRIKHHPIVSWRGKVHYRADHEPAQFEVWDRNRERPMYAAVCNGNTFGQPPRMDVEGALFAVNGAAAMQDITTLDTCKRCGKKAGVEVPERAPKPNGQRLQALIDDVANGDGFTVQLGGVLLMKCDTYGKTDLHYQLERVEALVAEWEHVGKHDKAAARAAMKLRSVLAGDW